MTSPCVSPRPVSRWASPARCWCPSGRCRPARGRRPGDDRVLRVGPAARDRAVTVRPDFAVGEPTRSPSPRSAGASTGSHSPSSSPRSGCAHCRGSGRGAPGRPVPPADRGQPDRAAPAPDAAGGGGLELGPVLRGRTGAGPQAGGFCRRGDPGRRRGRRADELLPPRGAARAVPGDKSFLGVAEGQTACPAIPDAGDRPRYGLGRLAEAGEEAAVGTRSPRYLDLAETADPASRGRARALAA